MCLDILYKKDETPPFDLEEIKAFCLVDGSVIAKGCPSEWVEAMHRPERFYWGEWYCCGMKRIDKIPRFVTHGTRNRELYDSYTAGFHVFFNKKDALNAYNDIYFCSIAECAVKGIMHRGRQYGADVYVTAYRRLDRLVKPTTLKRI